MIGSGGISRGALAVLALTALGAPACGGDGSVTKAGGTDAPVVLRFGTDDFPGRAGADQIEEFGRRVEDLTDGEIRIEGVWEAGGDRQWDQVVAQDVIDGELDGGNIPARAWDLLDVGSMAALHTPFLVTSEDAMNAVVSDDTLAADLLAGLDNAGVTGLALVPDSIRYLFGLREPPLTTVAAFDGAHVRAPASKTTWAFFEALGAVADDRPAVADGSLAAMESSFGLVDNTERVNAIGNLPLFPKVNVLVVNDTVFERLDREHREALRTAALATRDWAIATNATAIEAATEFCTGATVVHVEQAELEAFHDRVEPLVDRLASDPLVAAAIDRLREVVGAVAPATGVPACAPPAESASTTPAAFDVSELEGTYRFELTADDMRAGGVSEDWIDRNDFSSSLMTITLSDGVVVASDYLGEVEGTYSVSGQEVTFRIDEWASHWVMTPRLTDEGIAWTFVDSLPPWGGEEDGVIDRAFWTTHPWIRVAEGG